MWPNGFIWSLPALQQHLTFNIWYCSYCWSIKINTIHNSLNTETQYTPSMHLSWRFCDCFITRSEYLFVLMHCGKLFGQIFVLYSIKESRPNIWTMLSRPNKSTIIVVYPRKEEKLQRETERCNKNNNDQTYHVATKCECTHFIQFIFHPSSLLFSSSLSIFRMLHFKSANSQYKLTEKFQFSI